jgi:hypothetical protein
MRKTLETAGFVLTLMGISGTIDHLAKQPLMGIFLNFFNRVVFPRVDVLAEHKLYANLLVAALGLAVLLAASRVRD